MKTFLNTIVLLFISLISLSCADFLDAKPSIKMTVPTKADDLYAVLNNVRTLNYSNAAALSEMASDNVHVIPEVLQAVISVDTRNTYTWSNFIAVSFWFNNYRKIGPSNVVLDNVELVTYKNKEEKTELLGMAYFYRSYSYLELAQVFSKPYNEANKEALGLVLRQSSDVNEKSVRSNLEQTYQYILADFKRAANLLPVDKPLYPTRPYKASAYAALARTLLIMGDYAQAKLYADSCLELSSALMDYRDIATKAYAFEKFNPEVVFYSEMFGSTFLTEATARVSHSFYNSYADEDQRKRLFFSLKPDGFRAYVGDYAKASSGTKFCGLTTAEVILIQAECMVRGNDLAGARNSIDRLLKMRYTHSAIPNIGGMNQTDLLKFVLEERRKELLFRGLRWSDMRRLSVEELGADRWERDMVSETFVMTKERLKDFAYKIPELVIEQSGIEQND